MVTGGTGQLATELALQGGAAVTCVGRPAFDFDRPDTVEAAVTTAKPALVINAAAYTAVDKAEAEEALATRINGEAVNPTKFLAAGVKLFGG